VLVLLRGRLVPARVLLQVARDHAYRACLVYMFLFVLFFFLSPPFLFIPSSYRSFADEYERVASGEHSAVRDASVLACLLACPHVVVTLLCCVLYHRVLRVQRHLSGRVGSARGIRSDRGALRAYEGASAIAMFCCGPLCSKNPCITPVRYRSQAKTFELHLAPISESNPTTPVIPSAPAAPTHEAGDLESKATPV